MLKLRALPRVPLPGHRRERVSLIAPGAWVFPSQACTFVYAPTFPSSRYASSRRAGIGWTAEKAVIILLDSPPSAPICCHSSTALDRRPDSGDRE